MAIRDNQEYCEIEEQMQFLKLAYALRPALRLMGEDGRKASSALDQIPELEQMLEDLRSAPDAFNHYYGRLGWVAHELVNHDLARRAIALAQAGNIDGGEQLLARSIDRDTLRLSLNRVGRIDTFRAREEALWAAFEDHCAGRYRASVLQVLVNIDGIAHDLVGDTFYIGPNGDKRRFVIDNTIVGHDTGISTLAAGLAQPRRATTTAPLDTPHRHGTLHGRDIGYGTDLASAKAFWALIALCSFAELLDRERLKQVSLVKPAPKPTPTLRGASRRFAAARDPRTYFLTFPAPSMGKSSKYGKVLDPAEPLTTIPRLGAYELARELHRLGFACPPPFRLIGALLWVMSWQSGGAQYRVEILGRDASAVEHVEASFWGAKPHVADEHIAAFLAFVASVPYQGCDPARAREWVRLNHAADAETTIGPARLKITHPGLTTALAITAINRQT
jgi:hypothetical protein